MILLKNYYVIFNYFYINLFLLILVKVIKLNPNFGYAYVLLGHTYSFNGKAIEAMDCYLEVSLMKFV